MEYNITDFLDARYLSDLRTFIPTTRDEYLKHLQTVYNLKVPTQFPFVVHIEPTNICNQSCIMCCHPTMKRETKYIDPAFVKKALDECAIMQPWTVHFFFFGEPFLNKHTMEYIRYAKQVGIRQTSVTTNLAALDKNGIDELIFSGINSIHISFEGLNKEHYNLIRGKDHYDKVLENLTYLLKRKKEENLDNLWISLTYVQTIESNEEVEQFRLTWKDRVNNIHISPQFEYRNGSSDGSRRQKIATIQETRNDGNLLFTDNEHRVPCRQLWTRLVVLSNGELVPCSQNIDGELSLGNIQNISIQEAWTGIEMANLRSQHICNIYNDKRGEICAKCSDWDWSGKIDDRKGKQ